MKHFNHYESEFTQFIDRLKKVHPEIEQEQRKGFEIWWDKAPLELDEMQREKMSEVKVKAYSYE